LAFLWDAECVKSALTLRIDVDREEGVRETVSVDVSDETGVDEDVEEGTAPFIQLVGEVVVGVKDEDTVVPELHFFAACVDLHCFALCCNCWCFLLTPEGVSPLVIFVIFFPLSEMIFFVDRETPIALPDVDEVESVLDRLTNLTGTGANNCSFFC